MKTTPLIDFMKPALTINRVGDLRNAVEIMRIPFIGCQFDLSLGFQYSASNYVDGDSLSSTQESQPHHNDLNIIVEI